MSFKCKRCLTDFNHKHHLSAHLTRKKVCCVVEGGEDIHQDTLRAEISNIPAKIYECECCNKKFATRQSIHVHKKKCIEKHTNQNNALYVNMRKEIDDLKKEVRNLKNNKQTVNINNTNTINNITNITLNNWGNENRDHITHDFLTQCALLHQQGFKNLIEQVHFNPEVPENRNIVYRTKNSVRKWVNNEWHVCDKNEAVEDMINKNAIILQAHVLRHIDDIVKQDKCYEYLVSIKKDGHKENFYMLRNSINGLLIDSVCN
jgi:hypothetical protein